jgi:type VI secretion system protein
MALKLTILSEQRAPLGSRGSIVFGVGGGSIGRAHDNDWVLPDPQRYLSAHHARVRFRNGGFHLLDTSTNGVFINDRSVALGRRSSYALRDGDRLRIGEYRIAVSIDGEATEATNATEASAVFPVHADPAGSNGRSSDADLGADFNMRDLLRPDSLPSELIGALGGPPDEALDSALDGLPLPALIDDAAVLAFDQSDQQSLPPRAPAASRRELRFAERAGLDGAGIEAFCRGAGIDPKQFSGEAQSRALLLAGSMLREALVGLKGLALAQREMRTDHHVAVGREDPQQIGLTGLPVEDLMRQLMHGHEAHELDAVQWLRDTFGSARRHDLALVRALRAALAEFIARLDPLALAQNGASRPTAGSQGDAALLAERFRGIAEMPAGRLPLLFTEAFARVFAQEFKGPHGP